MGNFLNNGPKILKLIVRVLSLPEHVSSPPCFGGIRVARSLVFCVVFVDHCLSFLFWPLYCLSFLDLLLLITPICIVNLCNKMLKKLFCLDRNAYDEILIIKSRRLRLKK